MIPKFSYVKARSVKDALSQLSPTSVVHAGGSDLMGCMRDQIFAVEKIVSISGIQDLRGINETSDGSLRIGALATVADLAADPVVNKKYPGLARAASAVSSPQLRNQGTVGGNLCQKPRCWYYRGEFNCLRKGGDKCFAVEGQNQYHGILGHDHICCIVHPSDLAPMLTALGAQVKVVGAESGRTVPLDKFFVLPRDDVRKETILKPNELITEIVVPKPRQGMRCSYRKIRARRAWDFAVAGAALVLNGSKNRVDDVRIVLSGAAPIPWRCVEAERVLKGKNLSAETAAKASKETMADAEPFEHNAYKIPMFRSLVEQELLGFAAP